MHKKGVKVALAFSNDLISLGLERLLSQLPDIASVKMLSEKCCVPSEFNKLKDTIVLTDFQCLYNAFPHIDSVKHWPKIILLDTNCGKENITMAVLKKRLCGVLPCSATLEVLLKSLKAVLEGEVWLDNETVKGVINDVGTKDVKTASFTARENEIINLTGKGYRNKEIAKKLNISEQTVKTHLYRIFQKLNIKTRSELVAYALRSSGALIIPIRQNRVEA